MTARIAGLAVAACLVAQPGVASFETQVSQLAAACSSCHQAEGHAAAIPSIVGGDARRTVALMLAYRSGERRSQIMHIVATGLSLEEIDAIAGYLAAERP